MMAFAKITNNTNWIYTFILYRCCILDLTFTYITYFICKVNSVGEDSIG